MVVTTQSIFPGTGFNSYATEESLSLPEVGPGMYVYANPIVNSIVSRTGPGSVSQQDVQRSPYDNETQVVAAHVAMHEIGHSFSAGENDDGARPLPFGEVYSGEIGKDETSEQLNRGQQWSIMRLGWTDQLVFTKNNRLYYVFSIEEATSVRHP